MNQEKWETSRYGNTNLPTPLKQIYGKTNANKF